MHTHVTATEFLSVDEQTALLAVAQDVPTTVEADENGEDRCIYGKTPESEAALSRLTTAFMPAVLKAARASRVQDFDDALATALAEFMAAVREYDVTSRLPFSATLPSRLRFAVLRADRANDVITVKDNVAAVYWRLIHKHDGDANAAYEEVKTTDNNLAPSTFLAVHHIIEGVDSLDGVISDDDDEDGPLHPVAASVESHEERIATEALVDYLFSKVNDRQEGILRLAYGFSDLATEKIRLAKGYAIGELMSDLQVAHALDLTRPTVQRDRKKALDVMRAAVAGESE